MEGSMSRTSALTHTFALLLRRLGAAFFCAAILTVCAWAQDTAAVPHLVQFNGTVADTPQGKTGAVFALYKDQTDRMPLWQETQSLDVDAGGRYIVQLGAGSPEGIPVEVFGDGQAHWLGVQIDGRAE